MPIAGAVAAIHSEGANIQPQFAAFSPGQFGRQRSATTRPRHVEQLHGSDGHQVFVSGLQTFPGNINVFGVDVGSGADATGNVEHIADTAVVVVVANLSRADPPIVVGVVEVQIEVAAHVGLSACQQDPGYAHLTLQIELGVEIKSRIFTPPRVDVKAIPQVAEVAALAELEHTRGVITKIELGD